MQVRLGLVWMEFGIRNFRKKFQIGFDKVNVEIENLKFA